MAKVSNNHVVTNKVRLSYAHLTEPVAPMNGGEPVYSVCLIIPKTDEETVNAINTGIDNAISMGADRLGRVNRARLRTPLRDGDVDREGKDLYANCWFINAKTKKRPLVVDKNRAEITNPDEIYSGMYANVALDFFAYSTSGNSGVSCALDKLQKVADGERLNGGHSVSDDFSSASGGSDELPF